MPRHRLEMIVQTAAAPTQLWQRITDVGTWDEWGAWDESSIERNGHDPHSAVGTVWTLRRGAERAARYEVLACDHEHFAFDLWSGLPFYTLRFDVTVVPVASGGSQLRVEVDADVEPRAAATITPDSIESCVVGSLRRLALFLEASAAVPQSADIDLRSQLDRIPA